MVVIHLLLELLIKSKSLNEITPVLASHLQSEKLFQLRVNGHMIRLHQIILQVLQDHLNCLYRNTLHFERVIYSGPRLSELPQSFLEELVEKG